MPVLLLWLESFDTLSRDFALVIIMNGCGWSAALLFWYRRFRLQREMTQYAKELGIDARWHTIERLVTFFLSEIQRKNSAFSVNLIQKRIVSKEELSGALEKIVAKAYRLLGADSAELALCDDETGMYHAALVLGKPFRSSAQAMLAGGSLGEGIGPSPDVLVQPIAFAGSVLGTLRVGLKAGRLPSVGDREIMNLLALQAGIALMNAEYSSELVRLKQNSEESIRAKTGFLANLSHELRGPLGIMLNAVELVVDGLCGPVTTDQLDTLKMAHKNGAHLLELINDVLDYAKVESGRITANRVEMAVQPLLEDIAGVIRGQAESKHHKLICKKSEEALALACDRRHIRQMLINLLTNAVKYTPDKGTIELWAERLHGNKIKINVKDSGIGIDAADRSKVFAAFERIENSYAMNQVGTGLGMPLTRRLAEVNGGAIDFTSEPGKGSHFWLILPAAQMESVKLDRPEKEVEISGKGNEILFMEREKGEREMITRYLTHLGFRVHAAATTAEALEILRERELDIAVVGNNVADDPNEDLVALIRNNSKRRTMPLVLVSSRAFVFDIERYLKAGVDRCLVKPLKLRELALTCRTLIDGTFSGAVLDANDIGVAPRNANTNASTQSAAYQKLRDEGLPN